jgi:lipoate-protein ligase A
VTEALLSDVRETGEAAVRTWTPGRQVAFGRRDVRTEGHERARATARDRGFPPVERRVDGRAVAFADATVAVLRADPVAEVRRGIAARYGRALDALEGALSELDAAVVGGEPPRSFCPGAHSLSVAPAVAERTWPPGGAATGTNAPAGDGDADTASPGAPVVGPKLAGVAQRVRRGVAATAAVVVVDEAETIAGVLESVYAALGVPLDPATVGSVRVAGGPADAERVARALEATLVGDREPVVERVA